MGLEVFADSALGVGKKGSFEVIGYFNDNLQRSVTERVIVSSSDTSVLRLEGVGRAIGVREGKARVQARFGEMAAIREVQVLPEKSRKGLALTGDLALGDEERDVRSKAAEGIHRPKGGIGVDGAPLEMTAGSGVLSEGPRGPPSLSANRPNPFRGTTVFHCRSPTSGNVAVYTLLGQRVRRWSGMGAQLTSSTVVWDGRDEAGRSLPSGIYFLVFEADNARLVRRMTLIR